MTIYEVHLGSWRRNGEEGNRWLTYRELAERCRPMPKIWASPISNCCRYRISLRRLLGLSATACSRRPAASARRRIRVLIDACHEPGSASSSTGCPGISPTIRTARPIRRHRALRARRSAPGSPLDWGHADLQLRPRRGRQVPVRQRAVLVERYGVDGLRVDAVASMLISTTAVSPANGCRTSSAAARISKRSPSCAAPTRACSASSRTPRRWRRNRPRGRWCRGPSIGAASASASNGTWGGCTTRSTTCEGPDPPPLSSRQICSACSTPSRRISSCR